MRTPASKALDGIISKGIGPFLKESGFKKHARHFSRLKGEFYQVVEFQSSQWNTAESVRFCVNLNIVLPYFHRVFTGRPFPKNPGTAACLSSKRLGCFKPDGLDHWWNVEPETEPTALTDPIVPLLRDAGLPHMDRLSDLDVLLRGLEDEDWELGATVQWEIPRLILLSYTGRTAEAQEICQALEENPPEGHGWIAAALPGIIERIEQSS